jgi:hypothetical protein
MRRVAFRTAVARFVHSALRRRRLLVLAGKIVFADGAAKLPEHFGRLALGVQGLARLAAEGLPSEHGLDSVPFVLLGDRRQAHNLMTPSAIVGKPGMAANSPASIPLG